MANYVAQNVDDVEMHYDVLTVAKTNIILYNLWCGSNISNIMTHIQIQSSCAGCFQIVQKRVESESANSSI